MKLNNSTSVIYKPSQPFSFEKTFYKPSHFPSMLECYSNISKTYFIPFNWSDKIYGIKFSEIGKEIEISIFSNENIETDDFKEIISELDYRFSLSMNYSDFYEKYNTDKFLSSSIERTKGKHISTNYSLYHHLIVSIFLQNTTIKRTINMCDATLAKYGTEIQFDSVKLMSMWEPKELKTTEDDLRDLKLGYRAKSILKVTDFFIENDLNEQILRGLETKQLIKELLKIYGVGKQTVFYLALSQFHRIEYLKHIPLWERKVISKYLFNTELLDESELLQWFINRYEIWCGFAFSLLWEDIFFQHKQTPFPWLTKIQSEKNNAKN